VPPFPRAPPLCHRCASQPPLLLTPLRCRLGEYLHTDPNAC
jgi:hypothetical protein